MKMTKALVAAILALSLMLAAVMPAMAIWGYLYVNKANLNVYEEDNTDSRVLKTVKGGTKLTIDALSPNGKWAQITVKKNKLGFVQMKYLSEEMPQSFCPHEWGKWKVEREATCTRTGYRYRLCKICGIRDEQETKKTGHDWGNWKVTKEATCVKKGTRTRTCRACGQKEEEQYYAEHQYGNWNVTKEPTCTAKGQRERVCKVCNKVDTRVMDMLPHEYEWKVTVEATDHSAGKRAKVCKVCGHNGGEESFDPEGTLRRGDRGDAVKAMQQLLVEQHYLSAGGADGIFGGGTEKALMQYQKDRDLNPDGVAWPQTLEDLEHDFGPWETERKVTRTEAGERVRVCRGCGFEQRETIQAGEVFERGRRGEDIRALQQIVKQLGYDAGGFDGIYGKKLDAAFAGFAADHDLTVENGKIRPADVDAVVSAWIEATAADTWKGEGDLESPVNLALTVTPVDDDDEATTAYNWTLTNLGDEKCTFTTLLLTYGDTPDFKGDDLVMVVDGVELKANSGNSANGTFTVAADWGEGKLNFAAMAITESDGGKWLSNTVTFDDTEADIAPIEQ